MVNVGSTVSLAPVKGATSRTKNRLRENGTDFIVMSDARTCQHDRGHQMWILFESAAIRSSDGKGGKEPWVGWLPVLEIEVTDG